MNLEREYQSRPDKYVGLQMKEGMEYGARLQRILGDQHLCGGEHWSVTVPDDGRPGTFSSNRSCLPPLHTLRSL